MCGIAGFLRSEGLPAEESRAVLRRMAGALAHRGPDDEGFWCDAAAGVALCHRRLSIVDLSPLGHQPMSSESGRFTITFNGEIYNHEELRAELRARGHTFRGSSDTEVLLAALDQWDLATVLRRCRGMFGFGLWDEAEQALVLARDRFGEKPLFYGEFGGTIVFGSELKALRQHPAWRADIDRGALAMFLRHGYIPAPHSIYRQVRKLPPGHFLRVCRGTRGYSLDLQSYWQPTLIAGHAQAERGSRRPDDARVTESIESVHEALQEAIRLQMVADVPVGAFLSGGIDSSLVVALMQQTSSAAVRTFSIGFAEQQFNEAPFARQVARHLGTDHCELTVTPSDALAVVPRLASVYDEPFADSSQIPTMLLCQLARRDVTVSLSGDGGDELFGGYGRYLEARARWSRIRRVPGPLRRSLTGAVRAMPPGLLRMMAAPLGSAAGLQRGAALAEKLKHRAEHWNCRTFDDYYRALTSYWSSPGELGLGALEPPPRIAEPPHTDCVDETAWMMYVDTCIYMPDDVLVKLDRAAMAIALETRVPLLDPQVAEAAWRIPTAVHLRDGRGKWVLRQLLERYVPRELTDRPKMGFGVPIGRWLRGELKEWAGDLLSTARLRREGYLDPEVVEERWRQHVDGRADWGTQLWIVLMFQSWLSESMLGGAPDQRVDDIERAAGVTPSR